MNKRYVVATSLAATALILPIAIYLFHFGWHISSDHVRWAEFGSAMSGIYTPVLAAATLAVLLMQVGLQAQVHKHEQNQAYVQQARAGIEFYLHRLDMALSEKESHGNTVREILHSQFQPTIIAELDSVRLRKIARDLDTEKPQVQALVGAIQTMMVGLSSSSELTYVLDYTSATQKLIAVLSFKTCVTLENYHRTCTEDRLKIKYQFSPLLVSP